jgi:subtilisin family serine protease
MKLLSSKGRVNAWLGFVHEYVGYEGNFISNSFKWAVNGDNSYTLGEMACTKNALTVAAYASKVSWRNLAGSNMSYSGYTQTGRIVPFSSHGPTADGRNKPDIAAPGMTLASAVNSFDVSYAPGGGNYDQSVAKYTSPKNNRDYYYAEASGTSMSSPMMSGIVALMLQVNPKLDPGRLKQILAETAIIDNFTTPTPDPTRWGFGKVNAYAAIKKTIQTLGLSGELQEGVLLNIYPNPTNGKLYIDIESNQSKILEVVLMDLNGKKLIEQNWNTGNESRLVLDLEGLQEAIYLVQIKSDTGIITRRIIVSTP